MFCKAPYGDVAALVKAALDPQKLRRRGMTIADMQEIGGRFGVELRPVWRRRGYLLEHRAGILGFIGGEMDKAGHWVVLKAGAVVDPDGSEVWDVWEYAAKHKARPSVLLVEGR